MGRWKIGLYHWRQEESPSFVIANRQFGLSVEVEASVNCLTIQMDGTHQGGGGNR